MEGIKISVSIPTYNRLDLLRRCMESVFEQTVAPNEIIVVDDFSTDGTWEYLKKVPGIRAIRNEKNLGMIGNWNESIRQAKYDYVVSLHSDDLILPEFIKVWKEKISGLKNPDKIAAFISGGFVIDANDRITGLVKNFDKDILSKPPKTIKSWWKNHFFCVPVTGWTVYNKKILEDIGYFTTKYRIAAENEMTAKMIPNYPVFYSSTPLFCFRRHGLQGFEGKVKIFSSKQEIENTADSLKVYLDFGIDIKKPVVYMLFLAIAYTLLLKFNKARIYLGLFLTYYPANIISWETLNFLREWTQYSIKVEARNIYVRSKSRNKNVFEIYKSFSFKS